MTLQNRVLPTGQIVAHPARGTFTGNRGILHRDDRTLGQRRWTHKAWICCTLDWQGRRRPVMTGRSWTELFFLDEAVALAAGHRPCARCRRADHARFRAAWVAAFGPATAAQIDHALHTARIAFDGGAQGAGQVQTASGGGDDATPRSGIAWRRHPALTGKDAAQRDPAGASGHVTPPPVAAATCGSRLHHGAGTATQRTHVATLGRLPPGTCVLWHSQPHVVGRLGLQRYTPTGYQLAVAKDKGAEVTVLTPAPLVAVLAAGYVPQLHDSCVV